MTRTTVGTLTVVKLPPTRIVTAITVVGNGRDVAVASPGMRGDVSWEGVGEMRLGLGLGCGDLMRRLYC